MDVFGYLSVLLSILLGLAVTLGVVSLLEDVALAGSLPETANVALHAAFIGMGATLALSGRPRVHEASAVVTAVRIRLYVALLFSRLG